jgi:hypothetical protein
VLVDDILVNTIVVLKENRGPSKNTLFRRRELKKARFRKVTGSFYRNIDKIFWAKGSSRSDAERVKKFFIPST